MENSRHLCRLSSEHKIFLLLNEALLTGMAALISTRLNLDPPRESSTDVDVCVFMTSAEGAPGQGERRSRFVRAGKLLEV